MKNPSVTISQKEYEQFKALLKQAKEQEAARLKAEKQKKLDEARQKFSGKADPHYSKLYDTTTRLRDMAYDVVFDTAETAKDLAKDAVSARKYFIKLQEQLKKVEIAVEALEQYSKEVSTNESSNK